MTETEPAAPTDREGDALEVLVAFLRLGCSAFGGPIAHVGYFREAFVRRRRWLSEAAFADLIAVRTVMVGKTRCVFGTALAW